MEILQEILKKGTATSIATPQSSFGVLCGRIVTYAVTYPAIPIVIVIAVVAIAIYKLYSAYSNTKVFRKKEETINVEVQPPGIHQGSEVKEKTHLVFETGFELVSPEILKTEINDLITKAEKYINTQNQLTNEQQTSLLNDFRGLQVSEKEFENVSLKFLLLRKAQLVNMERTLRPFLEGKDDPCRTIVGIPNYGGVDCWLNSALVSFAHLPLEYLLYRPFLPVERKAIPPYVQDPNLKEPLKDPLEDIPDSETLKIDALRARGRNKRAKEKYHSDCKQYQELKQKFSYYERCKKSNIVWKDAIPEKPKEPEELKLEPETVEDIKNLKLKRNQEREEKYQQELREYERSIKKDREIYENRIERANSNYENSVAGCNENRKIQTDLKTIILKIMDGKVPSQNDIRALVKISAVNEFGYLYNTIIADLYPKGFTITTKPVQRDALAEGRDNIENDRILLMTSGVHDTMLIKNNQGWTRVNDSYVSSYAKDDIALTNLLTDRKSPKNAWRIVRNWLTHN